MCIDIEKQHYGFFLKKERKKIRLQIPGIPVSVSASNNPLRTSLRSENTLKQISPC